MALTGAHRAPPELTCSSRPRPMAARSRLEDVLDLLPSEMLSTALLGKLACVSAAMAGAVQRNLCWEGKFRRSTQRAKYDTIGYAPFLPYLPH